MAEHPARLARLKGLEEHLRLTIRGQDHILPRIASIFVRGELGLADPTRPRGSLLLCGPTGTGKTETVTCVTSYVFGPGHLACFDMSEYQDRAAVNKLLGHADRVAMTNTCTGLSTPLKARVIRVAASVA